MKKWLFALVSAILLLVAAGLIFVKQEGRHNEAALNERVNQYWEAVKINDQHTRYRMMTAYVEGNLRPDQLKPQMSPNMKLLRFKVGKITMEEDGTAEVEIEPEFTLPDFQGKGFKMPRKEVWSYIGGDWYKGLRSDYLTDKKGKVAEESMDATKGK
ncbi:MAG: hypothetical protein RLZZ09_3208 [Pseudomonadota bacterium]|jgi:hypothetical protein